MGLREKASQLGWRGVFIAGTDTEVGKTYFTCNLAKALLAERLDVRVIKPVASGAEQDATGNLKNEDALAYQALFPELPYELINPICFEPAIAPHIAAAEVNATLNVDLLDVAVGKRIDALHSLEPFKHLIVEGAGGWQMPLNNEQTYADWVVASGFSVILVVGMRLGCLNHALLTHESIVGAGVPILGWVANPMQTPMSRLDDNITTLRYMLPTPHLGVLDNTFDYASLYRLFQPI